MQIFAIIFSTFLYVLFTSSKYQTGMSVIILCLFLFVADNYSCVLYCFMNSQMAFHPLFGHEVNLCSHLYYIQMNQSKSWVFGGNNPWTSPWLCLSFCVHSSEKQTLSSVMIVYSCPALWEMLTISLSYAVLCLPGCF